MEPTISRGYVDQPYLGPKKVGKKWGFTPNYGCWILGEGCLKPYSMGCSHNFDTEMEASRLNTSFQPVLPAAGFLRFPGFFPATSNAKANGRELC